MMIELGKNFSFNRINGMTTITGYVLAEDSGWFTIKESDLRGPVTYNKQFISSYRVVE